MRVMLDRFEKRQAVTAWRDHWRFHVWTAMNKAGQKARKQLELDLPDAGNWDVYVNNATFADPRIDRSMRSSLEHFFDAIRVEAASELHVIDPALDDLGLELTQMDFSLLMPTMPELAPKPTELENTLSIKDATLGKVIGGGLAVAGAIIVGPEAVIATGAYGIASLASPLFHGWVRNAGSKRLAETWLGTIGEPLPVMPKIAAAFDDIAAKARNILS